MGTPGPRPKTKEQKLAQGEKRKCRLPDDNILEFPTTNTVPDPPKWLKKEGKAVWNEIAPALHAQRVLTTADVYALGHLCQLHQEMVEDIKKGIKPTAADRSQLRMYFSEFGMTPSSRTRIGISGDGKKENPFKRNGVKSYN